MFIQNILAVALEKVIHHYNDSDVESPLNSMHTVCSEKGNDTEGITISNNF